MLRDTDEIKRDLSHVYWIVGISRGGKSTVSAAISEEFGFPVYDHDKQWLGGEHVRRADPKRHPTMFKYKEVYEDLTIQRFLASAPVETLVDDYFDFFIEQFEMVVDDLYELPRDQPIVAEGCGLLPESVSNIADTNRAIALVPTEDFERLMVQKRYEEKPEPWSDTDVEWHSKWRVRWEERTAEFGLKVLETGGSRTVEDTICAVKTHFGLC